MKAAKFVLLAISFLLAGCARRSAQSIPEKVASCWREHNVSNLEKYAHADAKKDAELALAAGDSKLQAVRGIALYVPGLDAPISVIKNQYGISVIDGTADSFCDMRHEQLNSAATRYALIYNQIILGKKWPKQH